MSVQCKVCVLVQSEAYVSAVEGVCQWCEDCTSGTCILVYPDIAGSVVNGCKLLSGNRCRTCLTMSRSQRQERAAQSFVLLCTIAGSWTV